MKKIKLLIIPMLLLLCVGCVEVETEDTSTKNYDSDLFKDYDVYTDNYTCVEYFIRLGGYGTGSISPRYNADGTLRLNKECLNEKDN